MAKGEIVMFGLDITFDQPWFLWLLPIAFLPLGAAIYLRLKNYRSMAGFSSGQSWTAVALRTLVLALFVLCLAEMQIQRTSEKLTVIYLLDQSESIPHPKRQAMMNYVIKEVSKHRNARRKDAAGVIVFGREAVKEITPYEGDIPAVGGALESLVGLRTDATNLEEALKLAHAMFPEDSARRVVIVSDGNENLGDARSVAQMLADDGIGLDVKPIHLDIRGEIDVEKITLPTDIRKGQPVETRVVLNNYNGRPVKGVLTVKRKIGSHEQLLSESEIELAPGKNVRSLRHKIEQPSLYTYHASFKAAKQEDDEKNENNEATAFTYVRGKGRVLLIEDWANKGQFDFLADRLRDQNLEVRIMASNELFSSRAELLAYDTVVLANVPRSSGEDVASVSHFTDEQIKMLVNNTEQMGAGLVMLGGENSFGVGGWANTEIEKAMPVDFQIKNKKVQAVGALVLMMHASEMAQGNYWQKVVGQKAIETLGFMDYCGVVQWGMGGDSWLWGNKNGLIRVGNNRQRMIARLGRMTPGDMPDFNPAMRMALAEFNRVSASVKHMIVISDGDPTPPNPGIVAQYRKGKIRVSTVAVGTHGAAGHSTLQALATATKGKYYVVTNPKALPKIYQREARRVARPLIHEPGHRMRPQVTYPHQILSGIDEKTLPPITGFVLTTKKSNPLVEQSIVSPEPADTDNSTILATWTYGAGRTAVFTTDTGKKWATDWTQWENYDKFFYQLIHWSMRPINEDNKFTVSSDVKDGRIRVVVTALDKDDEFLNFLNMNGSASGPDMEPFDIDIKQVAPGRYVGEFDASKSGTYFMTMSPGAGHGPLLAGVNVPYSSEFRDRQANVALLERLAEMHPPGGEKGELIEGPLTREEIDRLLKVDTFRHNLPKAISSSDIWPVLLLLAAAVFFWDVFFRRVAVTLEWFKPAWAWVAEKVFRRQRAEEPDERIERLRSQKAAIASQINERRAAAARFEPQADAPIAEGTPEQVDDVLRGVGGPSPSSPPAPSTAVGLTPGEAEEESYTARLMKAKKKALDEKKS